MIESILNQDYLVAKVLVTVLVSLFIYVVFYIRREHQRYDHLPGPPRDNFFVGNIPTVIKLIKNGVFLAQQHLDLTNKYGKLFRISFLHRHVIVTSDPEVLKEILVTGNHPKDEYVYKHLSKLFGIRFLGNGLVTNTDQKVWVKRRIFMNPCFQKSYLRNLTHAFNEGADNLLNHLEKVADGKTKLKMLDEFNHVALDIIAKVGFGMDLKSVDTESNEFTKSIFTSFQGLNETLVMPFFELNPMNWKFCWKVRRALQFLRSSGKKVFTERKTKMDNGEHVPDDILSFLVRMKEEYPEIDMEDVLDEFVTFFVAGQETSANVMSYVILCLGQNPDVLTRLRNEVASSVGDKAVLSFDDLSRMPYMDMVLKETLRLYPPAVVTMREVKDECTMAGHRIPADTTVVASMYTSSHLDCFFEDPFKFDPERFSSEGKGINTYSYFPFSIGPRTCIGKTFAESEIKIIMTKFLQKFNFELDPDQDFGSVYISTLRPKDKVICTLTLRDN